MAIASHVGDLADLVEHVTAGEHEDTDQADGGPRVSVLDDREDVRPGFGKCASNTEGRYNTNSPGDIVDRTLYSGVGSTWQMAGNPGLDLFSRKRPARTLVVNIRTSSIEIILPIGEIESNRTFDTRNSMRANCWGEEHQDRGGLEAQL